MVMDYGHKNIKKIFRINKILESIKYFQSLINSYLSDFACSLSHCKKKESLPIACSLININKSLPIAKRRNHYQKKKITMIY